MILGHKYNFFKKYLRSRYQHSLEVFSVDGGGHKKLMVLVFLGTLILLGKATKQSVYQIVYQTDFVSQTPYGNELNLN